MVGLTLHSAPQPA